LNDPTISTDYQTLAGNLTTNMITSASITVNNLNKLCPSQGLACQVFLPDLETKMASFASQLSAATYKDLLISLLVVLLEINPWTVGLPVTWIDSVDALVNFPLSMPMDYINYGGRKDAYTLRFDLGLPNTTDSLDYIGTLATRTKDELGGFTFDEFVVVSNGLAGSTTAIFVSSVEQIWKNRDRSGATQPLTTVAYGGTGQKSDIALTAFPASIRDVNLDYPLVANAVLYVWEILVQSYGDYATTVHTARTAYESALYTPPYYSDAVPTLPVVIYYDTFMGKDGLPLQYVHMPPDEYISTLYTKTSLETSGDLASLYKDAAAFFPSGSTTTGASSSSAISGAGLFWAGLMGSIVGGIAIVL
jgi:hypothetical protein